MIRELDAVVLTHDIPEHGLKKGDVGAVVHCYADGAAWEVEFVTRDPPRPGACLCMIPPARGEVAC